AHERDRDAGPEPAGRGDPRQAARGRAPAPERGRADARRPPERERRPDDPGADQQVDHLVRGVEAKDAFAVELLVAVREALLEVVDAEPDAEHGMLAG